MPVPRPISTLTGRIYPTLRNRPPCLPVPRLRQLRLPIRAPLTYRIYHHSLRSPLARRAMQLRTVKVQLRTALGRVSRTIPRLLALLRFHWQSFYGLKVSCRRLYAESCARSQPPQAVTCVECVYFGHLPKGVLSLIRDVGQEMRSTPSSRDRTSTGAHTTAPPQTNRDVSPVSDTNSPVDSSESSARHDATPTANIPQRTFPVDLPRPAEYWRFYRRFPMSSYFQTDEDDKPYVLALTMLLNLCPEFFRHTADLLFRACREPCGMHHAIHPTCTRLGSSAVAARIKWDYVLSAAKAFSGVARARRCG